MLWLRTALKPWRWLIVGRGCEASKKMASWLVAKLSWTTWGGGGMDYGGSAGNSSKSWLYIVSFRRKMKRILLNITAGIECPINLKISEPKVMAQHTYEL